MVTFAIFFSVRDWDGNAWLWLWLVAFGPEVHGEAPELLRLMLFTAGHTVIAIRTVVIRVLFVEKTPAQWTACRWERSRS